MYLNNGDYSCCTYISPYPPHFITQCFNQNQCPPVWQGYQLFSGGNVPNCDSCQDLDSYVPQTQHDYKQNMPRIPEFMYSRYGWKIKELNGKKYWAAMNKKEYQIAVANVLGIHPSEVTTSCGSIGDTGCDGFCPSGRFCESQGGPDTHFCHCRGIRKEQNYSKKDHE